MRNIPGPDVLTIVPSLNPPEPIAYFDMHTGVIYTLPEEQSVVDCLVSYDYAVQVSANMPVYEEHHPVHRYCSRCGTWRDLDGECCGKCGALLIWRRLGD